MEGPQTGRRTIGLLLLLVVAVQVAIMPAYLYRGDPHAVRAGTIRWLQHGSPTIPRSARPSLPDWLDAERGQYFYEREDGSLRSKYGSAASLVALPPVAAARMLAGPLAAADKSGTLLLTLNLWNVLIAALAAYHLFRLAQRYTARAPLAAAFVIATFHASFVGYYLRAQTTEVFQIWLVAAFADFLLRAADDGERTGPWIKALAAAAALALLKPYYLLLFGVAALGLGRSRWRVGWWVAIGAGALLLRLADNAWSFGDPLEFGYGQWEGEAGERRDRFGVGFVPEALTAFLIGARHSVFLHAPLLLFALAGVPAAWRRDRRALVVSALIGTTVLAVVCLFSNWDGLWSYGPRYLVPVVPLATLPAVALVERVIQARRFERGLLLGGAMALVLGLAGGWQLAVQRLEFHIDYAARNVYRQAGVREIDRYFRLPAPLIFRDLAKLRRGGGRIPPEEIVLLGRPGEERRLQRYREAMIEEGLLEPNYYWLVDSPPPR